MSNPTNYVSAVLAEADKAAVLAAFQTIRDKLPFLHDVAAKDGSVMGDKSQAFVNQALTTANANPASLAGSFDLEEFVRDMALWNQLQPIAAALTQLHELFDDTLWALEKDLYTEALTAYGMLKAAGLGAGLDELKAAMSQRFKRSAGSKTEKPKGS